MEDLVAEIDGSAYVVNVFPPQAGQQQHEEVHILGVSLVKPVMPTVRHSMYLSAIDQLLRLARPSRTILFYHSNIDRTEALHALRKGLASALVQFYPMAGRLQLQEKSGRLALDCNDEGVELIEAHCDTPFEEVAQDNFRYVHQLAPMEEQQSSDVLDSPLASFQVTSFVGGMAVGIAMVHSVVDGHSMWTFIRAVAHACRGLPLTMSPLHARTLLMPEVFLKGTSFPHMESDVQDDPNASTEDIRAPYNNLPPSDSHSAHDIPASKPPIVQQKVIHFSPKMLETLKKACVVGSQEEVDVMKSTDETDKSAVAPPVSTYQALAAYLWKRLTIAQEGMVDDETCVNLRVSADVRNRMIPPLTAAYVGNAIVGIPTMVTAGQLRRESLGATAARIKQSIREGSTDGYIKRAIIAREKLDVSHVMPDAVQHTMIRNATGFPVYEGGDFGWGEPAAVRPPWEPLGNWEGEFTWYPGKEPKSIDVIASLTQATSARFFSSATTAAC